MKCPVCSNDVYPSQRISYRSKSDGKLYHRTCFDSTRFGFISGSELECACGQRFTNWDDLQKHKITSHVNDSSEWDKIDAAVENLTRKEAGKD